MLKLSNRLIKPSYGTVTSSLRFLESAAYDCSNPAGDKRDVLHINSFDASDPTLFHRRVVGRLRELNKRASREIRKDGSWVLACVEGRNKIPNMVIQVQKAPFLEDIFAGRYSVQKRGKARFSGPLYELVMDEHTTDEYGKLLDISKLPFDRLRVLAHNIRTHRLTDHPLGVSLRYSPENEPVRIRIPMKCINQEKSPGIREGGWLNRLERYVNINVAPFTRPPNFVTMDVSGMQKRDKKYISDLQFEGKGEGCQTVLDDDVPAIVISK